MNSLNTRIFERVVNILMNPNIGYNGSIQEITKTCMEHYLVFGGFNQKEILNGAAIYVRWINSMKKES